MQTLLNCNIQIYLDRAKTVRWWDVNAVTIYGKQNWSERKTISVVITNGLYLYVAAYSTPKEKTVILTH